jgi:hypothetical protein
MKVMKKRILVWLVSIFLISLLSMNFTSAGTVYRGYINTTNEDTTYNWTYPINNSNFVGNVVWGFTPNQPPSLLNGGSYVVNCSSSTSCNLYNSSQTSQYPTETEMGNIGNVTSAGIYNIWQKYLAVYHLSGGGMDSSGNGNHLTVSGASVVSGKVGNAVRLFGTTASNMQTNGDVFLPTTNFTVSMWIMKQGDGKGGSLNISQIFCNDITGVNTNIGLGIPHQFADVFRWRIGNTNCDSTTIPATDVWYHLVAVFNGTDGSNPRMQLYVNGIKECDVQASFGSDLSTLDLGQNWVFGADDGNQIYFNGTMDEIRVMYGVITPPEVNATYETQAYNYSSIYSVEAEASNTQPSITNIAIFPAIAYHIDTLNCSATYTDNESNKGNISIYWYNETALYSSITKLNILSGDMISDLLTAQMQNAGENWNCTINASDGNMDSSPQSSSITILGYAITDCREITTSGKFTLPSNITNSANSTCIFVNVSDVEIDCQNYEIDGQDTAGTVGIYLNQTGNIQNNITIRNCSLSDWGVGIVIGNASSSVQNSSILNNKMISNIRNGISIQGNDSSAQTKDILIGNNSFIGNTYEGLSAYTNGVGNLNIINNTFIGTGYGGSSVGLYFNTGSAQRSLIKDNYFTFSTHSLYFDLSGHNSEIVNNNLSDCGTTNTLGCLLFEGTSLFNITGGQIGYNQINANHYSISFYGGFGTVHHASFTNVIGLSSLEGDILSQASNITFTNCTGIQANNDFFVYGNYTNFSKRWYATITVKNSSGSPIEDVNVSIYDRFGDLKSANTTADGKVSTILLEYTISDGTSDKVYYSNYTINATDGEIVSETESNLTGNLDILLILTSNVAPEIREIGIAPSPAYKSDTLNCSAIYSDIDMNTGDVSITWYNGSVEYSTITKIGIADGSMISDNLASGTQAKGEIWNCTVNATDEFGLEGLSNSTTVTISNTPPVMISVAYNPTSNIYKTTASINCEATANDVDSGDIMSYHYLHYKDDITTGITTQAITNASYSEGENWICEVYADDGIADSNKLNSSQVTILNSAPTIPSLSAITPNPAYTTSLLSSTASGSDDADGESIFYYYQINDTGDSAILQDWSLTNTFDCNISGCNKEDTIRYYAKAYDGTDYSVVSAPQTREISNSVPIAENNTIIPTTAYFNSTIICVGQSKDDDGDVLTDLYEFRNNTATLQAYSVTDNFVCNAEDCNVGAIIYCDYKSNDGTADSNIITNSTTIIAIPPIIPEVIITPTIAYRNSQLECSVAYSSSEERDGTVSIYWYNGTDLYSTNTTGILNNGITSSALPIGIQEGGEIWNCSANATDSMDVAGLPNSTTVTIVSVNMAFSSLQIAPSPAYYTDTLNCSANYLNSEGFDGNVSITWYNGTAQYITTTIYNVADGQMVSDLLTAQIQRKGEIWNCTVNATDETETESGFSSTTRTISNILPVMNSISLSPIVISPSDTANCTATASDGDGELLGINITFYTNGAYASSILTNTLTGIASATLSPQLYGTNITCVAFATDYTDTTSKLMTSKIVFLALVTLENPTPNQVLTYQQTFTVQANTNFVAQNCTFAVKRGGVWEAIGTNTTIGTNFTIDWTLPCENNYLDIIATCQGIDSNTAGNVKINTQRICCPQNDNGICGIMDTTGAGLGLVISNITKPVSQLMVVIVIVALVGIIGTAVALRIKNYLENR